MWATPRFIVYVCVAGRGSGKGAYGEISTTGHNAPNAARNEAGLQQRYVCLSVCLLLPKNQRERYVKTQFKLS